MILRLCWKYTKSYPTSICIRHSDQTYWMASSNGLAASMQSLLGAGFKFYFRRVYKRDNTYIANFKSVWEFSNGDQFDIVAQNTQVWVMRSDWNAHVEDF